MGMEADSQARANASKTLAQQLKELTSKHKMYQKAYMSQISNLSTSDEPEISDVPLSENEELDMYEQIAHDRTEGINDLVTNLKELGEIF